MVKWRYGIGRFVFVVAGFGIPGYTIGDTISTGMTAKWAGLTCAGLAFLLALAYTVQHRRVNGYRVAIARLTAKDAARTYVIWPEGKEDE